MPISAPSRTRQDVRKHIDNVFSVLNRHIAAGLDQARRDLLFSASGDAAIAGDEHSTAFENIFDIIIRGTNIDLYLARRHSEDTRQQLITAYSNIIMPEPPTPTLTLEQYWYELDLWWRIEGRSLPKPPFWPQEGGHIDTMPIELPLPPIDPSMALVPLPGEESRDTMPVPVIHQRMPVPVPVAPPRPRPVLLSPAERRALHDKDGRQRRSRYWYNFTDCPGFAMRTRSCLIDHGIENIDVLRTMSDDELLRYPIWE